MNERIRELIKQATTIEEHKWGVSYDKFDKEKFAELIVRECAGIVDNKIEVNRYVHEAELLRECSATIKLHFGVEV
jgi:hypothetical protein